MSPSAAWTAREAVLRRQVGVPVYVALSDERTPPPGSPTATAVAGEVADTPDVDELRRAAELLAAGAYEEFGVPYDVDAPTA